LDDFIGMPKDKNFAHKVLLGDTAKIAEKLDRRDAELLAKTNFSSSKS